ncbi:MAG: redoxin domain-containing protein [Chlorobia bacterium]|nr:redoxin domain-containing protein [Fimbriimonadaceae bacterium]
MMRKSLTVYVAAGALACLAIACASQGSQRSSVVGAKEGDKSFPINTLSSDGKTHTVKSLTEKGPVYLLFVKEQCSANPYATPFFVKIHDAYGKNVNFVGVINAGKQGHASWKSQFKGQWTTLLDPEKKIISGFKVARSTPVIKIGRDGKVEKIFHGWGQKALKQLSVDMAKEAKIAEKPIDLSGAPARTQYG